MHSTTTEAPAALLANLVAIDSVNPAYPGGRGEAALAEWVLARCRASGLAAELDEVLPGRPNVLARLPAPAALGTLLFEAHLDTVSFDEHGPGGRGPELREHRLYGRGACDAKGSLVAMLLALERLAHRADRLRVNVLLLAAVDEERAGAGARHFVESGGRADGAVVGEPTRLQLLVAHKGCVRFRLTALGEAAHSSDPTAGQNAIYAMADLLQYLRAQLRGDLLGPAHPLVGPPTWSVGTIRGGAVVNIVPDSCTIEVDRRLVPGETPESALDQVDHVIANLSQQQPSLRVVREPPFVASWPLETAPAAPIVQAAQVAREQVLGAAPLGGAPYGTDASLLAHLGGVPSLVFGPGDIAVAHGPDEYVDLEQVAQAVDVYEAIALAFDPTEGQHSA
jgi:acetylornithine deacetylase/succinyl-diaminopimelate desuccinylase-like protein